MTLPLGALDATDSLAALGQRGYRRSRLAAEPASSGNVHPLVAVQLDTPESRARMGFQST